MYLFGFLTSCVYVCTYMEKWVSQPAGPQGWRQEPLYPMPTVRGGTVPKPSPHCLSSCLLKAWCLIWGIRLSACALKAEVRIRRASSDVFDCKYSAVTVPAPSSERAKGMEGSHFHAEGIVLAAAWTALSNGFSAHFYVCIWNICFSAVLAYGILSFHGTDAFIPIVV